MRAATAPGYFADFTSLIGYVLTVSQAMHCNSAFSSSLVTGYSAHMSGNTSHCMCEGSGFDVDPFGRVFYPNLGQFRIEVIDTNNNPITTFGKYGNEDSGGPNARVTKPDIVRVRLAYTPHGQE